MPAYHSNFNEGDYQSLGNLFLLPLKTKVRGPATQASKGDEPDIIDEALQLFKANVFFRNFEFKGNADRVLVYLLLYITDCLNALTKCPTKNDGSKKLNTLALENFAIPGEPNFVLPGLYQAPADRGSADTLRQYFSQLRQELGIRLIELVYADGNPSKWWLCFAKRKFMNKNL